jgi:hypothetical protein
MRRNFPFGFRTKPSGEYIKGVFPSTGITLPRSRSSNSVTVILRASRRAVERFFETCREGRPLKPTLHPYVIIPSIRTGRLPRYSARKTAHILRINGNREFIKGGSELSNTSNSGVQLGRGYVYSGFKVARK